MDNFKNSGLTLPLLIYCFASGKVFLGIQNAVFPTQENETIAVDSGQLDGKNPNKKVFLF